MNKIYILLLIAFSTVTTGAQQKLDLSHIPPQESLSYDIFYHWGALWKRAGEGTFILKPDTFDNKPSYKIALYGRTLSFVETLFPVRDTLLAYASKDGFVPMYYTKRINEGGYKATDIIKYSYDKGTTTARVREIGNRGGIEDTTLHRETPLYDMLTVFYYLRSLELHKAKPNQLFVVEVVTGRHIYKLRFKFMGITEVDGRKKSTKYTCYKVQLLFENSYGKIDDDTMVAYVSCDPAQTPIQLEAKLRIGSMRAIIRE